MSAGRITSLLLPAINVIFGVTTAAILGLGAHYVDTGAMEVGSLVANSQYISMVLTSVIMLSLVIMMFPTTYACAARIAEVLETETGIKDGDFPFEQRPLRSTLEFRHVTFAYPGADEPILKDISFSAHPGEITAIIGGTGRGKSSILKLIPRLYDPLFGEILVDGVNIRQYRVDDLRSIIGYVPQKNVLFSGDIASNLNFGKEDGTEEDWARAAGIAALDTVYSDVNNEEGFLAEAMLIKKLGFDGKSVINPRQIEPLHRVFMPSEKDLNKARLIMAAIEEANARGSGVASLKGKMIDKPVVTRARRLLDLYEAGSKIDEVEEI